MALRDIKPTRSELINLKRKIQLSERGYKLLKMKRDGLILEFFKILANAKDSRGELLALLFTHDFSPLSESQLSWLIEEQGVLTRLQPQVSDEARQRLLESADESTQVLSLWTASLQRLGLDYFNRHPEELDADERGVLLFRLLRPVLLPWYQRTVDNYVQTLKRVLEAQPRN